MHYDNHSWKLHPGPSEPEWHKRLTPLVCSWCGRGPEWVDTFVRDKGTDKVYCDMCAAELRNICHNVPHSVPLTKEG